VVLALLLLGSAGASAFDCASVRLPSSLVICSDPELMRLADERQEAFNEALARLDPQQQKELLQDQNGWVRSYAAACGVPPDRVPPSPVPDSTKECFKRAAQARIAYIRAYGLPGAATPPFLAPSAATPLTPLTAGSATGRIGPSFDCTKAVRPLALMICASPELSRDDLRFVQAYQALRQRVGEAGQRQLRQEAVDFDNSVLRLCGVPETGAAAGSLDCVGAQYNRQMSYWAAKLTGAASEEANRGIERHIALQRDLCALGYCASLDFAGVYGPNTRTAIMAWQQATGRAATGFIGDDDAAAIEKGPSKLHAAPPPNGGNIAANSSAPQPGLPTAPAVTPPPPQIPPAATERPPTSPTAVAGNPSTRSESTASSPVPATAQQPSPAITCLPTRSPEFSSASR
jgi:uncharacterized protein/peptidoglycan hydrolase-like protein with peptidoglycan-binding domain